MNLLREGVTLSNTKTEQKEMDFNLSNEKQTQFIKAPQDNFIIPRKSGENINFFNNFFRINRVVILCLIIIQLRNIF